MQFINSEIRAFLLKEPRSDAQITDFMNNLIPDMKPTAKYHEMDLEVATQPVLVYAHLMVQDMRDSYYYYSFIMKRPFKADDNFNFYRWGNAPAELSENSLESHEYLKVMMDREQIVCTPIAGLSKWAAKLEGSPEQIELMVDGNGDFKLGEIINVVAFYHSDHKKLYFVRKATPEEEETENLNPLSLLPKATVDFEKVHQELLSFLSGYSSQIFAEYILLCLLSYEPMFLGAEADISPLIEAIYPRVKHLKLVNPLEESLFPYKNEEGEMMAAPLQLSNDPTFVSLDLSEFSKKDVVEIGEKTINNFKALKIFVEESKTIYRWEYGESLLDHRHRGIIIKASSFLTPHFHPKEQAITPDFTSLDKVPAEELTRYREYLAAAQAIEPELLQEERVKIEESVKAESTKDESLIPNLGKIMQLAKLVATSYGRKDILFPDFERARFLVGQQVVPKQEEK